MIILLEKYDALKKFGVEKPTLYLSKKDDKLYLSSIKSNALKFNTIDEVQELLLTKEFDDLNFNNFKIETI